MNASIHTSYMTAFTAFSLPRRDKGTLEPSVPIYVFQIPPDLCAKTDADSHSPEYPVNKTVKIVRE